ncbi:hypothetical protein DPMN_118778 [Dreissena polymorpha]|uniref:Aminotransferase class I/classII domain-containing protein n=1 Tax=Dreissena polymorpha TaxID=45954 RepID=A0A9D4GH29_DREPO|nr:hypothetical protein DPMN_118778 [Dreissena polymorpha]
MFLWVRFLGVQDSTPLVMGRLLERKCLIVTGSAFVDGTDARSPYVRISFSLATDRKMEEVIPHVTCTCLILNLTCCHTT